MNYAPETVRIATPIGTVVIDGNDQSITRVMIIRSAGLAGIDDQDPIKMHASPAQQAAMQLRDYFAKRRTSFDLPLAPALTPRGTALRDAIAAIGFGKTLRYGALARACGSSARAIGQACARNPFPIIIPCHRVLSAGDRLGAYSAGDGPITKAWLLDHESESPQGRMFA